MKTTKIKEWLLSLSNKNNKLVSALVFEKDEIKLYPKSIKQIDEVIFFIGVNHKNKFLYLCYNTNNNQISQKFDGEIIQPENGDNEIIKKCNLSNYNRKVIQKIFPFTNAKTVGLENSFGFGDRLGLANPAHIRAVIQTKFIPILSQQSIRELARTNRTPAEVMDASVWAVFQEGLESGFGADADHLKTTQDIDLMVENGFRLFTFDPSEYVYNEADVIDETELDKQIININWEGLKTDFIKTSQEFEDKTFILPLGLNITADKLTLKRAVVKYGNSIAHIKKMYDHLVNNYPGYDFEVEVSVDETESVTTPFEHFFFAKELNRLGVKYIGLAPRFVGDFEKGIDYKGDLDLFKTEYIKHIAITKYFGDYKISLHSGSDKFSVYKVIGELKDGYTHIKTAGTSYLEALKVIAIINPVFFREILDYCTKLYENEKKSYHVSADINLIKPVFEYTDKELVNLFNDDNVRQVLHVTFGRILTDKNTDGEYIFKTRILEHIENNEELHYEIIEKHFLKHMDPFN
ncbi:MAG: tagaturonate epimerase family protein [bacterium]